MSRRSAAGRGRGRRGLPMLVSCVLALLVALDAGVAGADRGSIADELFRDGRRLMDAGEIDAACDKFAASMRAEASVGALVNLARCHELAGKSASAQREYRQAADLAEEAGEPKRAAAARKLAGDLDERISTLTVQLDHPREGLRVLLDGRDVSDEIDEALPVDPGSHRIEATAPGHSPYATTVTVSDGADRRTVVVPSLQPVDGAAPAADTTSEGGGWSTFGWVLVGVGATTAAVGSVVGVTVLADADEARHNPELCPDEVCTPAGDAYLEELDGRAAGSTALLIVGGAMTVAGLVTALTSDDDEPSARHAPSLRIAVGPASFGFCGRF